jgi:hypothetical protein
MSATQELAFRAGHGIAVSLLWAERDDRLTVQVWDETEGASFSLPARRDNALDVFYHPFAYAARAA